MKRIAILSTLAFCLLSLSLDAQVPPEFTDLYAELEGYLTNFDATLDTNWNGTLSDCLMAATLMPATSAGRDWSSAGDASTDTNFLNDMVVPYLDALQALGIKSIKFAIQFPILYQPFYAATNGENYPAGYTNTFNFYSNLVVLLRQRGIKIIIPTESIIAGNGADTTTYERSLTFPQFVAGRSALIQTIARYLKPDYLILQSEPETEAANLPANLGNQITNAAADMLMISNFLTDLQTAGLRSSNTIIGAGCGTAQSDFTNFLAGFTTLPGLDLLDIHVYQINHFPITGVDELQRIIQMADAAHVTNAIHPNGMRVGIGEYWLYKQANMEYGSTNLGANTFRGRNVYSCFSPLDREMQLCMVKVAHYEQFDFIDPYWTEYFFSYLDYTQMQTYVQSLINSNLSSDAIGLMLQNTNQSLVFPALLAGQQTATAQGYAEYIEPGPPLLRITNNGAGSVSLGWSPVAIKFLPQQNPNSLGANWTTIPVPPRAAGSDFSVTLTTTNNQEFFRLHQP
ncbi:exported hypothetical protein [Verrucomicrobia bacterium]|nr:exported hypothetical protein [Verrucomicrobiota bacterium]